MYLIFTFLIQIFTATTVTAIPFSHLSHDTLSYRVTVFVKCPEMGWGEEGGWGVGLWGSISGISNKNKQLILNNKQTLKRLNDNKKNIHTKYFSSSA